LGVPDRAHYLLPHLVFIAPKPSGPRSWIVPPPTRLFVALTGVAASPARHLYLPVDRPSEWGTDLPL
jgi:hypothetical protein